MRTIQRDIVGAFIFSADGRLLIGNNGPDGVYPGCWFIPGGGVEEGETELEAVRREVIEEVGIDIREAEFIPIDLAQSGSSAKTLKETGERVNVEMTFRNFRVDLPLPAAEIPIIHMDDFRDGEWVSLVSLDDRKYSPSVEGVLSYLGFLTEQ